MGWITDLVKEIPISVNLQAKLDDAEKKFATLEARNKELETEVENLRQEIQRRDDVIQKEKSHSNLLDDAKVKILLFLAKQPEKTIITSNQIAQCLQMDEQAVIYHLETLIELNMKMILVGRTANAPKRWSIGPGGRHYLVENGHLT